ncbi:lysosomal-associated transmembrane protein 4B-like [Periophthalmus magnuspinnatus]|uniref:lysosomal-associated transmembrane protein 4B-like n=1 Tax=Periophthalmus magnuspinnatus TaxID=409849 RepID=UPI00145B84AB|nr:lysosomal-associated transmembrane protein 4B-like [Periophthalmus magnuspinnatus]
MSLLSPGLRSSTSCCLCCHVRTGTILLGVWHMLFNMVVLTILLPALWDPHMYQLISTEFSSGLDVIDDDNTLYIVSAISLLMIIISGMATYGAFKLRPAWIIPFLCYECFDFCLNSLVALCLIFNPSTIRDYVKQLPNNFLDKEVDVEYMAVAVAFFITCILIVKAYLILCVWRCYVYVSSWGTTEILNYITTNDTTVLIPPYDDTVAFPPEKSPPPPSYSTSVSA